ncbi:MAG TPA: hypothetical protein VM869_07845 [Enhygromyxa sp.]|nr:hypothetical protein [Enhygromyxa sp.]
MLRPSLRLLCVCSLVLACGEDGRDSNIYTFGTTPSTADGEEPSDESVEGGESAEDGEDSESESTGDGDGDGEGDGDGDGEGDGDGDGDGEGDGDPTTDGNPCGNGVIDPGEDCDGGNLGGSSCAAHGFDGGVLGCDAAVCVFDTSGCTSEPSNECDAFCGGCSCPSFECTMCCAQAGKVDTCGGGSCGCF